MRLVDEPILGIDGGGVNVIAKICQPAHRPTQRDVGEVKGVEDWRAVGFLEFSRDEGGFAVVGVDDIDGMLGEILIELARGAAEGEWAAFEGGIDPGPGGGSEFGMPCATLAGDGDLMAGIVHGVAEVENISTQATGVGAGGEMKNFQRPRGHRVPIIIGDWTDV